MSDFKVEEYEPFKVFLGLLPTISATLDPHSELYKSTTFHDCATHIFSEMYKLEKSFDQKVQRQYYEYQELYNTVTSFLEFYGASCITDDEADAEQQRTWFQSLAKTRTHLNNFLKTRKIE